MKYIAILDDYPQMQEIVYGYVLKYCRIIQGTVFPWSELYNDVYRSDIHRKIAKYCDCDESVVAEAVDEVFPDEESLGESVFLENVDRLMDQLRLVAMLPERDRRPSAMTEDEVDKAAEELTDNLNQMPDLSGATKGE